MWKENKRHKIASNVWRAREIYERQKDRGREGEVEYETQR